MSRRKRYPPRPEGAFDALVLAAALEMMAAIDLDGVVERIAQRPPPPKRTDDWFIRQLAVPIASTPINFAPTRTKAKQKRNRQLHVHFVRWKAVAQARLYEGLSLTEACKAASKRLEGRGPPFAGKRDTMERSYKVIQSIRKTG